jgi:outer membrane protein W
MKKILFFAVMLLLPIATNAQLAIKAGLSGNVALSDMTDYWVGGPGVDLNIKYIIANHFGIGISSGFQHFFSNDDWDDESHDYDDENLNIVPLRLSFTYYLGTRRFKPYIGAELGVNYVKIDFSEKYSYYDPYYGTLWSSETNSDDNVSLGQPQLSASILILEIAWSDWILILN